MKEKPESAYGILNSCRYSFPLQIAREMEADGKANVHFHEGFCCYYRQKTFFVWEYQHNQFELPLNLCSHEFPSPITSAFVGPIEYDRKELGNSLVLVAYGHTI